MFVESVRLLCVGEYGVVLCKGLMCVRVVHIFVVESLDESPQFVCVCAEINCAKCFCCVLISAKDMSGDVGEVLVLKGLRVGVWGLLRIM